jgi:hypothetical protein
MIIWRVRAVRRPPNFFRPQGERVLSEGAGDLKGVFEAWWSLKCRVQKRNFGSRGLKTPKHGSGGPFAKARLKSDSHLSTKV